MAKSIRTPRRASAPEARPVELGCSIISDNIAPHEVAEEARVRAVARYRVLDMPPERVFERIAGLAARVCGMPMAKVSIVDHDRIWFMALYGLATESRQIDPSEGLCAQVIADELPQVVADVATDPRSAQNAFVRTHGIRSYACAPITTADGLRLGTVTVMDRQVHEMSDADLAVLEDLAAIVMEQLEWRLQSLDAVLDERRLRDAAEYARDGARVDRDDAMLARSEAELDRDGAVRDRDIAERERDVIQQYATALQQTLLPPRLPDIDGMELAAHYYPASPRQVGGDFYDVFALGGDRWAFFIGDVEGHGVGAAVATSLVRYTLRAAALHYVEPILALEELNRVLLREQETRRFCTVLLGLLDPDGHGGFTCTIATGGHPPGLLVSRGSDVVQQVRSSSGMLVGAVADAHFDSCTVSLRSGQTLLLFTDGIVEARRGATPFDEERLAEYVAERAQLGAGDLVADLATMIPKLQPDDDVALLAFSVM